MVAHKTRAVQHGDPADGDLATTLCKAVRSEIRVAAILDQPATLSQPPACDYDAEDGLIAAAREGHVVDGVDPNDFSSSLHATVWVIVVEAKRLGLTVSTDRVLSVLARDGYVGGDLRSEVQRLFDYVGICRPDQLAASLRRCARLRRLSTAALQLDALTRTGGTDEQLRELAERITREVSP